MREEFDHFRFLFVGMEKFSAEEKPGNEKSEKEISRENKKQKEKRLRSKLAGAGDFGVK